MSGDHGTDKLAPALECHHTSPPAQLGPGHRVDAVALRACHLPRHAHYGGMSSADGPAHRAQAGAASFATTHWSVVLAAGQTQSP
ncbi:MAG: hypothetical protein FJ387_20915 [Verrucomicrobia bacterium]|nr:hypothetical protein [Verrucomicrobiota bacterium]